MSSSKIVSVVNAALRPVGAQVLRTSELERLYRTEARFRRLLARLDTDEARLFEPSSSRAALPAEAAQYLTPDNPRLLELARRYRAFSHPVANASQWNDDFVAHDVDLRNFRGDTAYVFQQRDLNADVHYGVAFRGVESADSLGLFARLTEDDLFGAYTVRLGDATVSRDLLDSVVEIAFLDRALGLSRRDAIEVLDVGAGYGRLAHRLTQAFAGAVRVQCVDAVAVSTFLCEFYLRFRGADARARVVPLDELDAAPARGRVDLAVNVHSFSECPLAAITAWIDLLAAHEVRHLFVVPNPDDHGGTRLLSREVGGGRLEFLPVLAARGYRLVVSAPKYADPFVQKHGVTPTWHYLFERG